MALFLINMALLTIAGSRTLSQTSSVTSRTFTPHRDLQTGQEVLARWSDDGWYYVGVILKPDGDDRYYVGDSTGYIESILLEDIIVDMDNNFDVIQVSSLLCYFSGVFSGVHLASQKGQLQS